jgi:hypothetical protein
MGHVAEVLQFNNLSEPGVQLSEFRQGRGQLVAAGAKAVFPRGARPAARNANDGLDPTTARPAWGRGRSTLALGITRAVVHVALSPHLHSPAPVAT